jgi:hypothetical protein
MAMATDDAKQAAEANRLYWGNEASVAEIAERLGVSRRALYELLSPRPSGVPCPRCDTETVFVNRSALTSGNARCPACEHETRVPAGRVEAEAPATSIAALEWLDARRLGIGGAALAGIAVGAIAALLITRRD